MAIQKNYDVIICGAGPAGSTAALALVDSGLRVAVIEKYSFPRDKICGDAVASYVPKVLNTINPRFKDAALKFDQKVIVDTCRLYAPNKKYVDISSGEYGFIASRVAWDNFLYELASKQPNITYFLNQPIIDVSISQQRKEVIVKTKGDTFTAKLIIGCDGAQSIVNKKITKTRPDLSHYSGAVRAYFKNVSGIPDNTFELHFIKEALPGYFWIFPIKDNMANVGLGALSKSISNKKMNLRKSMMDIIQNNPYIKERFANAEMVGDLEGFGLPLGSRKVTISGDHFMLCGDAAALIDPASGEGIGQAMVSGRYAGWHAKKCFEQNNFTGTFMKGYDKLVYDKLWWTHRKHFYLQKLILDRAWLLNGLFTFLKNKTISRFLIKAMG